MGAPRDCFFVLPGDPATPTGGYHYDRQVIAGLRAAGQPVTERCLTPGFPFPGQATLEAAERQFAALPDGATVIVDGLAFGAMPDLAGRHATRLRLVALVHHPLALETGLPAEVARGLLASERRALAAARAVVVTSRYTAESLRSLALLDPARATPVTIAEPGIDDGPWWVAGADPAHNRADGWPDTTPTAARRPLAMLYVASLTPRKGHEVLFDALARVLSAGRTHWRLTCAGSAELDPGCGRRLAARLAADDALAARVQLAGAVPPTGLPALYHAADLYLNPSLWEGYGMAAVQAVACGLPVITTTAGALAHTVPAAAALAVPPGDADALAQAIVALIDEPARRARLAEGARAAGPALPRWPATVARFQSVLQDLEATG